MINRIWNEIFELSKTDISLEDSNGENRFLDIKDDYITRLKIALILKTSK